MKKLLLIREKSLLIWKVVFYSRNKLNLLFHAPVNLLVFHGIGYIQLTEKNVAVNVCYFYFLSCLAGSFIHYSLNPQVIKEWWQALDRKGLHFIQNPLFAPLLPEPSPQMIWLCKLWVMHSLVPCTYLIIIAHTSFNGEFRDETFGRNRN